MNTQTLESVLPRPVKRLLLGRQPDDSDEFPALGVSLDTISMVTRTNRRVRLIEHLADEWSDDPDARLDMGEVAEHVASEEYDCSSEQLSAKERKRVYVNIYQTHIPKLSEADIAHDDGRRNVFKGDQFEKYARVVAILRKLTG